MDHGVYAPAHHHEREGMSASRTDAPKDKPPAKVTPVPVYVVSGDEGSRPVTSIATQRITLTGIGGEPTRIAPQDLSRVRVRLLNEDAAYDIRFSATVAELMQDAGTALPVGGAFLPHGMTTYLEVHCQSALWAICTTAHTPVLSVILEIETRG